MFCTLATGLDAIAEVINKGHSKVLIVGLDPAMGDPEKISGYVDISSFAKEKRIPYLYVKSYNLKLNEDQKVIKKNKFDLIWVAGWQRLIPQEIIDLAKLGAFGVHGSPDGIHKGRGRSPQNWALMLGCKGFELALFRITSGIDEGPVVCTKKIQYGKTDDILMSYYKTSLATADMMSQVLDDVTRIHKAKPQPKKGLYFPQRIAEDGKVDWTLPQNVIARHARALSEPYPGLQTFWKSVKIRLWECQEFDCFSEAQAGCITHCFYSGEFLVNCGDGRLLVRRWSADSGNWRPEPKMQLLSFPFAEQLKTIIQRHNSKYPSLKINPRILAARSHSARRNRTEK